jgi:hypothetical protein
MDSSRCSILGLINQHTGTPQAGQSKISADCLVVCTTIGQPDGAEQGTRGRIELIGIIARASVSGLLW